MFRYLPHGQIHWSDSKQGERVNFDHDGHKCYIQDDTNQSCGRKEKHLNKQ